MLSSYDIPGLSSSLDLVKISYSGMSTALFIVFKLAGFDCRTLNLFSQGVSVVGCPVGRINVFFTDKSGRPRHHSVAPFLLQLEDNTVI
jgi:hypothetical protein